MSPDQFLRAGGDLNLVQGGFPNSFNARSANATEINLLRRATKNILYTVSQSSAMNGMGEGVVGTSTMAKWKVALICVNVGLVALSGVWGFFAIRKGLKKMNGGSETSADEQTADEQTHTEN